MGTTGQSITLANSIIGVGILAMPFCFQQCGILLATLILLSMGLVSRLCCHFLLKSALLARRRNFEFLAFHVFGSTGKVAVEVGIIGFLMGTCIAYFVVVGDLGPQIVSKMFNINQSDILRTSIMVIVSLVCVLPLGLLRNVDSLSNVSAATIGFYLCLVIKVIAEAASQLPSGEWQKRTELWKPSGLLQCVPIFSMALFCQTQLFEIFESIPSLSLEKMNIVAKNAINICTGVYFTLGVFGYIAFCKQDISGNILMSLSPTMASDVIKLGFVMSLAFSFPLIIFPCRASIFSFLYKKVHSSHHDHIINHSIPETTFRCITVGIVAVALFISLLIPNIELVLGMVGSTIGVLICVVFPAACFLNVTFKNTNERVLAKGILMLGLVIMVLGTYANLQAAESQMDRYDDRYITQEKIDKIVEDFFEKRGKGEQNLKPLKKDPVAVDTNKINSNIIKDSEVQPPNPVPPDSNSNEAKSPDPRLNINVDTMNKDKLINDVLLPEKIKEEAADKVSDTHPKDLKTKLNEAKLANDNANKADKIENKSKRKLPQTDEIKDEKIKLMKQQQLIETMKQHGKEQKELMQEQKEIFDEIIKNKEISVGKTKETKPSNEPKIDINNKQQQLIETIKQHGQEQKELMKEQKEILNEIIKTKKEFQQNKEVDSNEAKKIAVESIKQIADMAIKSIGGVTEKPVGQKEDIKDERLEKITNEAVEKIAKKAVETIEAIQEIKEDPNKIAKPESNAPNNIYPANNDVLNNVVNRKPQEAKPEPIQNIIETKYADIPVEKSNPQQSLQKENIPNRGNEKQEVQKNIIPDSQVNKESLAPVAPKANNIQNDVKPHSHSPDEPQSYKVGEDSQIKHEDILSQKPLALAMSDQAKLENNEIAAKANLVPEKDNKIENNVNDLEAGQNVKDGANSNIIVPNVANPVRQKREIVSTKTVILQPEDKVICESLLRPKNDNSNEIMPKIVNSDEIMPKIGNSDEIIPKIGNSDEILPKIDLNDGFRRLPLDPNMNHIGRSLQSYDENDKER